MTEQTETNDLDRWVAALQQALYERVRAMFSDKVLAEASHPQNIGVMDRFDGYALVCGPCGDTMEMFVKRDGDHLALVTFMTDGCGPTVACGSMLTKMVEGKRVSEAIAVEAADLIIALDGLPPEHIHCATLAVDTLHRAIEDGWPEAGDEAR
jgi:nitrogen fixation NifU-like protein